MAARRRFVMSQVRIRGPDAVSPLGEAQAKIDVVESDAEIDLVESGQLLENRFAHGHARARCSRAILLEHRAIEVAWMPAWNMRKRVACNTPPSPSTDWSFW